MCIDLLGQYPLVFSDFNEMNFLDRFSNNIQKSNFTKILPAAAEFFHVDRWRDRQADRQKERDRQT